VVTHAQRIAGDRASSRGPDRPGQTGLHKATKRRDEARSSAAEYLLFLDDDTEPRPNYLESMGRLFEAVARWRRERRLALEGFRIARPLSRAEAMAAERKQAI